MDVVYAYDERNRISEWTIGSEAKRLYDYDDLGNLTLHAGETQEYSNAEHPHAITRRDIAATVPTTYGYDDDGNVTSFVGDSNTQYFSFDSANQAVCLSPTSGNCTTRVAYDVNGKRIAEYPGSMFKAYIGESFLYENFQTSVNASVEVMLDGKRIALKTFEPQLRTASAGIFAIHLPPAPWMAGGLACSVLVLVLWGVREDAFILVQLRPPETG